MGLAPECKVDHLGFCLKPCTHDQICIRMQILHICKICVRTQIGHVYAFTHDVTPSSAITDVSFGYFSVVMKSKQRALSEL